MQKRKIFLEGFLEIYKNLYRGREKRFIVMLAFATFNSWMAYNTVIVNYTGLIRVWLTLVLVFGWLFFFPSVIYLIDIQNPREPSKSSSNYLEQHK